VISSPSSPCFLIHTRLEAPDILRQQLKLYALLSPHLDGSGTHNSGWAANTPYGKILVARSERAPGTWLAMAATVPFVQCSRGVVGVTDGWQDLNGSFVPGNLPFLMDWSFDSALDSNIALTGQIDLTKGDEFVLGLAFGETLNSAVKRVRLTLSLPFQRDPVDPPERYNHLEEFLGGWERAQDGLILPGNGVTGDNDRLFRMSRSILMAHEDKTYGGALIAALSIPWGEFRDDDDFGYHLVWTRDIPLLSTPCGPSITPRAGSWFLLISRRAIREKAGEDTTKTAMEIILMAGHSMGPAEDAYGFCSRANEATMNWPPAEMQRRWFGQSKTSLKTQA
jgi:glucoamylase